MSWFWSSKKWSSLGVCRSSIPSTHPSFRPGTRLCLSFLAPKSVWAIGTTCRRRGVDALPPPASVLPLSGEGTDVTRGGGQRVGLDPRGPGGPTNDRRGTPHRPPAEGGTGSAADGSYDPSGGSSLSYMNNSFSHVFDFFLVSHSISSRALEVCGFRLSYWHQRHYHCQSCKSRHGGSENRFC